MNEKPTVDLERYQLPAGWDLPVGRPRIVVLPPSTLRQRILNRLGWHRVDPRARESLLLALGTLPEDK